MRDSGHSGGVEALVDRGMLRSVDDLALFLEGRVRTGGRVVAAAAAAACALAGAADDNAPTVGFLLSGLSSRLADSMREEMETIGKVTAKDAEEAMNAVVAAIRRMEQAGELFLLVEEEELDSAAPAG